jgi:hypothetical protein
MKGLHKHKKRKNEKSKNNMKKSEFKKNDKKAKEKGRIKQINMQQEEEILRNT